MAKGALCASYKCAPLITPRDDGNTEPTRDRLPDEGLAGGEVVLRVDLEIVTEDGRPNRVDGRTRSIPSRSIVRTAAETGSI